MNGDSDTLPAPRSGRKTLVIVLCVLGGVFLLLLLSCGGFFVWAIWNASTEVPAARRSAESFLNELRSGRVDAAYRSTSEEFRRTTTLEQFRQFVSQFPLLTTHTSRTIGEYRVYFGTGGQLAYFKVTVLAPQNALSFTVYLVKEEDEWRVQRLNVP
jgi:hypothetical protein